MCTIFSQLHFLAFNFTCFFFIFGWCAIRSIFAFMFARIFYGWLGRIVNVRHPYGVCVCLSLCERGSKCALAFCVRTAIPLYVKNKKTFILFIYSHVIVLVMLLNCFLQTAFKMVTMELFYLWLWLISGLPFVLHLPPPLLHPHPLLLAHLILVPFDQYYFAYVLSLCFVCWTAV